VVHILIPIGQMRTGNGKKKQSKVVLSIKERYEQNEKHVIYYGIIVYTRYDIYEIAFILWLGNTFTK
jgi:hypothetical protein